MLTSDHLVINQVYTREQLRNLFSIRDATINNGVFKPKEHNSIWLFITEQKPKDRVQYRDTLIGDALIWESQPSGRYDQIIIEHGERGLELLVFYRKKKYEFPKAGFRYLGPFRYVSHSDEVPRRFVFKRVTGDT